MNETLELRPARLNDSRELARVHIETWRHTYAGMVPGGYLTSMNLESQTRAWRNWIGHCGRTESILVAEIMSGGGPRVQRRIVGFGHAGPARDRDLGFAGEVFTLYVEIDWQGRGIGRRLLGRLFADLLAAGMNSAVIWVLASNPSRFFYEALGGLRVAERQERFAGMMLEEAAYGWPDPASMRSLSRRR